MTQFNFSSPESIETALQWQGTDQIKLFAHSSEIRNCLIGNGIYMRGLIELSNICNKECYYCGIRHANSEVHRYQLTLKEIVWAAKFAYDNGYGSIVIQAGERNDKNFVTFIDKAIQSVKQIGNGSLGITLSLGEQSEEVYRRWFESGAHRYLLRIESSNRDIYYRIHPRDELHSFEARIEALWQLKTIGYQTGSGIMIGLPWQTIKDLANDLLFFKQMDLDMVGMGPYIEHQCTPLYRERHLLLPKIQRMELTLNMIAVLRIMMPTINIAATTALQTIDPYARELALSIGANVIMPNITPTTVRANYKLYENKPVLNELSEKFLPQLEQRVADYGCRIILSEWGDSLYFRTKQAATRESAGK